LRATDPRPWTLRASFAIGSVGVSVLLEPFGPNLLLSLLTAAVLVVVCLFWERMLLRIPFRRLFAGTAGLILGIGLGALATAVFVPALPSHVGPLVRTFLPLATGFLGLSVGLVRAESFHLPTQALTGGSPPLPDAVRYLDSSALIDGRIADLVDAAFLHGLFVVPQFVLNELQVVADTADAVRRARGRRGLDVVARLQKSSQIRVEISPIDYGDVREVDLKLVEAVRERGGQLVTTDANLSRLARVQGIPVLNVNELATALRPVVLQGETLRVFIAREGKEANQGVAYLEDGTMVVVDHARRHIGKVLQVVVTSVVQSATGKMIFARQEDDRSSSRGSPAGVSSTGNSQAT